MKRSPTLGSLFDGSGGFPLAGAINGIVPLWASEIEPYPIAVTRSRFPQMAHLGSVTVIDGAKIPPVDVMTFGSPCQDMSVAGKRGGLDGSRSGLFHEAVRIIKEMRCATDGEYPTFSVWENVPGAFSSNKGEDFRCVLEEIAHIKDKAVSVPQPQSGKWTSAGEIVGDGFSIAWRVFDAQYWGVPQRRKRIYLVADFNSERAGKILFECEGMCGDFAQGGETREETAGDVGGSTAGSSCVGNLNTDMCFSPYAPVNQRRISWEDIVPTLRANGESTCPAVCFMAGQRAKSWSIVAMDDRSPTLKASPSGLNQAPSVVYAIEGNTVDRASTKNGKGYCEDVSPTMNTQDRHAVVYDARGNGDGYNAPTMTGDHENRSTDYTGILCMAHGQANAEIVKNCAPTLNCNHEQPIIAAESLKPPRRYIVRRLMPVECARLQGFPDCWGVPVVKKDMTAEEESFWEQVRKTYASANGQVYKPYKNRAKLVKWYNKLHTDSAEYKMWGNGIALPCAAYVLKGIAEELKNRICKTETDNHAKETK